MSAPTVAVVLADHVGMMLVEMARALNQHGREQGYGDGLARVRVEQLATVQRPFHVYIDEADRTFLGRGSDAGIAMLDANSKRQSFYEACARQQEQSHEA